MTFSLHEGECLGLIGGSGDGKSTLLRVLLLAWSIPTSGKIFIEGEDIFRSSQEGVYRRFEEKWLMLFRVELYLIP